MSHSTPMPPASVADSSPAAPRRDAARRAGCASRCCTSCCWARLLFARRPLPGRPRRRSAHASSSVPRWTARRAQLFKAARGRDPNADELQALRQRWLDNEVLYREGLALQVDKGDTAIRERVIFKALSVVDANVKLPPFDDKRAARVVRAATARKYDEPARFDFQEAVLAGDSVRGRRARLRRGAERRHARATRRPACACSRAGRAPTWCRATAPSSPARWRASHRGRMARAADARRLARDPPGSPSTPRQAGGLRGAARRRAAGLDRCDAGRAAHAPPCARWRSKYTRPESRRGANDAAAVRRCCCWLLLALLAPSAVRARDEHGRDGSCARSRPANSSGSGPPATSAPSAQRPDSRTGRKAARPRQPCCTAARRACKATLAIDGRRQALFGGAWCKVFWLDGQSRVYTLTAAPADGAAVRIGRRPARHGRDRARLYGAGRRAHPHRASTTCCS